MYAPEPFEVRDAETIAAFIERYDFASLITASASGGISVSHVPVIMRESSAAPVLVGHVARANGHWQLLNGDADSILIFQGPHGYVSPSWYARSPAVPTWNYAVVHAHGRPRARQDADFIRGVLAELSHRYEAGRERPWTPDLLPTGVYEELLGAIVGFEMPIDRCEAKFKLSQNRSLEDRAGVVAGLRREGSSQAPRLAELMEQHAGGAAPPTSRERAGSGREDR